MAGWNNVGFIWRVVSGDLSMIGIFDSGLGGIPVWEEIKKLNPSEDYVYVADHGHLPYGNKSRDYIVSRSRKITEFLIDNGAKTIVVACNSATTMAIDELRGSYKNVVFVGVEPALKPASLMGKGTKVLILGTEATLKSDKFSRGLIKYGKDLEIVMFSVPVWVEQVEAGLIGDWMEIPGELKELINKAEVVVLACTHYIFYAKLLRETYPSKLIIEPSKAVAQRVNSVVKSKGGTGKRRFVSTGEESKVGMGAARLLVRRVKVEFRSI